MNWYEVKNANEIDSPALLIYPDRVQHNINAMIDIVGGDTNRLIPHVKTHKMAEILAMQLAAGISRFKCATIAELEMCLQSGAKWVLMSYQLTGPKIDRFIQLAKRYPDANISSLTDNLPSAQILATAFKNAGLTANVYLDVNNGMNRTGHPLNDQIFSTYQQISTVDHLKLVGLHVYDGHIRNPEFEERRKNSDAAIFPIYDLIRQIEVAGLPKPEVITGGSPSFTSAALRADFYCSPGTTLLWDSGYSQLVPEMHLECAAVLMTRVISKPAEGLVTTDLGHKSVSAENAINKRISFLNLSDYEPVSQSEEHLVLRVKDWSTIEVGDIFYGIPYHVCPSVALYDVAQIIRQNIKVAEWNVVARKRKITV
ncbi:D-TA family PLP-dependent enzyme [Flavihumibacter fluvii]|uniref:D-TA family PLP-dependent enzyme n=1 Tax=Flavihumibacter fluvii TaxID=2838157 RepID=UPI001BDF070A|nr:D-TA family PLP-dependent enzyme [Flavihumibacter fluvii]ULQ53762.1 D-TA family PLP-dependent enzyme [Flavihumibacter fluvii]